MVINTVKSGQLTVVKQEQVSDLDQSSVCMTSCGSMLPVPYRPAIGATSDVVLLGLNQELLIPWLENYPPGTGA